MTDQLSMDQLTLEGVESRSTVPHAGQFRLSRIQVCNWGTLDGYHDLPVPRRGFLVTGASGSGKSTLIDAISAVLVPPAQLRFNAAAQEEAGRGSGRTLVSYIRGAWRRGTDVDTGELSAEYLRPKAVFSTMGLTYDNGNGRAVTLLLFLYLKSGDNTLNGVRRLHGLVEHDSDAAVDLPDFFDYLKGGIDKRGLKRERGDVTFHDRYNAFASAFRRKLGISSESAQLLLHRTLSAKSLSSLDQLFREYMLDTPATFGLAERSVNQFGDLREAHRTVVDVREQIACLEPLAKLQPERAAMVERGRHLTAEIETFPAVQREINSEILESELRHAEGVLVAAQNTAATDRQAVDSARAALDDVRAQLRGSVGNEREVLSRELERAKRDAETVEARHQRAAGRIEKLGGTMPRTSGEFGALLAQLASDAADIATARAQNEERRSEAIERLHGARKQIEAISEQIRAIFEHRSNISPALIQARELIAGEAGIRATELPFAGELIEVPTEHERWRPAAERVLAGFARTLLVPRHHAREVSRAVDSQHLGVRLTYEVVDSSDSPSAKRTGADSLYRKLRVPDGTFAGWLRNRLSRSFDYTCVEDAESLDQEEFAVTVRGLLKRGQRFEKDDRRRLDDRSRFQLGGIDDAKVENLNAEKKALESRMDSANAVWQDITSREAEFRETEKVTATIQEVSWDEIDVESARQRIDEVSELIERWADENPEYAEISGRVRAAEEKVRNLEERSRRSGGQAAVAEKDVETLRGDLDVLRSKADTVTDEAAAERIRQRLGEATRRLTSKNFRDTSERVERQVRDELSSTESGLNKIDRRIRSILQDYLGRWQSMQADLRAEPEFLDDAVEVLVRLRRDRLAEFEERFLELNKEMQHRNLGELARMIRKARSEIEEGIRPVNESLAKSEFADGRWLRIEVRDRRTEAVTTFLADLEKAVQGSLTTNDVAEAEKAFAVTAELLDRLASTEVSDRRWQQTVLDTRRHVGFIGIELDRHGMQQNVHDSSSGLSGGQAQKLVFFCLAAALRYQLADRDDEYATYGTVVLDEAFDRADPDYTRRAMGVFTDFGFHMVLATPLKLLQTLEPYLGGVAVVSNAHGRESRIEQLQLNHETAVDSTAEAQDA